VSSPLDLVPLHSGALPMPAVTVRRLRDGAPGDPLPLALASAATTVLVQPLARASFTAAALTIV